jgi:hypothetical protein
MDSLALLSSDVVLCEEVECEVRKDQWGFDCHEVTFTVVQVLKGDLRPKQGVAVTFTSLYAPPPLPRGEAPAPYMGRVVLFLGRDERGQRREVGVKPVIGGVAYCYGQFEGNPGGLHARRMAPENITVPAAEKFSEELLLKDLRAALEKSKGLKEPQPRYATGNVTRKDPSAK